MIKKENDILNTKNIAIAVLVLLCLIVSFYLYGRNKSKVFKDEYMENIFVDENDSSNLEAESVEVFKTNETSSEKINNIIVEIKGEVKHPDVYEMEEGSIIRDIIEKAGGLTSEANIDKINRAEKLKANQLIVIPNKNSTEIINLTPSGTSSNDEIININTASTEELQKISGIGEVKAQNIIKYREENAGFKSIEEIKNIDGIGEKTFEKIKDKISI